MSEDFEIPQTQYAESDGLSIAYQVFGSGSQDLVVIPGIVASIAWTWDDPAMSRMHRDLAKMFRVIMFDKRGQGLSDKYEGVPTLEERMDDVRVVMQAAGSKSAVLFAQSEGGAMAALFAATYPAMVDKLVLWGTMAKFTGADDYPHRRTLEQILVYMKQSWGKANFVQHMTPSRADDAAYCERTARLGLQIMSPSAMQRSCVVNAQIDVRAILPQIRRPTLILHRRGDRIVTVGNGRYLADHIPEATYLEMPGGDHLPWEGESGAIVDAIRHFALADHVHTRADASDRFLATVLFTDIVGSTELVVKLGDAKWRDLQQQFHAIGRRQLEAQRGREIDTAGDGLFAIFDGPARAIRCASAIANEARAISIEVRAGLHTGEVETSGAKVSGLTVHIGARVMALAGAGEVLVSSTVKDLVAGSGIGFEERGTHALKGVPGEWRLSRALAG
ncbi:MAG: adenylate/guanylate cyclase domain-containing protein [Betaproteobacteria bacterium]